MNARAVCRVALMAALMCIAAPVTIPVGPIPVTLATLTVYLAGICLGAKEGCAAVAVYLLLGAAGLPVFSGFAGGFQQMLGPTGGYFAGYLLCAATVGKMAQQRRNGWVIAGLLMGTAFCYAVGTAWFMHLTQMPFSAAAACCVLPFLPGDALKMAAAYAVGVPVQRRLQSLR